MEFHRVSYSCLFWACCDMKAWSLGARFGADRALLFVVFCCACCAQDLFSSWELACLTRFHGRLIFQPLMYIVYHKIKITPRTQKNQEQQSAHCLRVQAREVLKWINLLSCIASKHARRKGNNRRCVSSPSSVVSADLFVQSSDYRHIGVCTAPLRYCM